MTIYTYDERVHFAPVHGADQRYYASAYGRFNTPDPMGASAHPKNPASWNKYSYTAGDPVNRSDPRGTCYTLNINGNISYAENEDAQMALYMGDLYDWQVMHSDNDGCPLQVFAGDLGHCSDATSCMGFASGTGNNGDSGTGSSPEPTCVQNAIGAAASAAGLDLSNFSNITVQIVGTPNGSGGTYGETELNLSGATSGQVQSLMNQMCGLGFANNGMCSSSNVGPGGLVGAPHDGFDGNFRSPGLTNSVQVNTNAAGGNIQIDVDPYNPASSAWGVALHSILQWLPNKLTGTDNTYGCN